MKKVTALFLVAILLVFIAVTAFAACNHTWYNVHTYTKLIKKFTTTRPAGCVHSAAPHTHIQYVYETTQIQNCSKGCGQTRRVIIRKTTEQCPLA